MEATFFNGHHRQTMNELPSVRMDKFEKDALCKNDNQPIKAAVIIFVNIFSVINDHNNFSSSNSNASLAYVKDMQKPRLNCKNR